MLTKRSQLPIRIVLFNLQSIMTTLNLIQIIKSEGRLSDKDLIIILHFIIFLNWVSILYIKKKIKNRLKDN